MKLKASEFAFLVICIVCIAVGIGMSVKVRSADTVGMIDLSLPENDDTSYPVDVLNRASAADYIEISGIGEVKAADIIAFRDAIGGFKRVEQLKEVNGISDAIYARIIDHFYSAPTQEPEVTVSAKTDAEPTTTAAEPESVPESTDNTGATEVPGKVVALTTAATSEAEKLMREININSATAEELADALLIDIELAESIIGVREQIHGFSVIEEIYPVDGMSNETYRRIKSYIIFGD